MQSSRNSLKFSWGERGQYKTWTADRRTTDYGLGIKHRLGYKTRTKHYGLGIKY